MGIATSKRFDRAEFFRSCARKNAYSTFAKSVVVARMCTEARGKKIYVYRCEYNPNHWHLSHRLGKDGIDIHAPGFIDPVPQPQGTRRSLNRSWLKKLQDSRTTQTVSLAA